MDKIIVAILAGISVICWPPIPRWWYWETRSFFPPLVKPDGPRPNEAAGPLPDPWLLIVGVLAGVGGAIAWSALGDGFRSDGGILPPLLLGALGGAVTGWLVNGVRNLSRRRAEP